MKKNLITTLLFGLTALTFSTSYADNATTKNTAIVEKPKVEIQKGEQEVLLPQTKQQKTYDIVVELPTVSNIKIDKEKAIEILKQLSPEEQQKFVQALKEMDIRHGILNGNMPTTQQMPHENENYIKNNTLKNASEKQEEKLLVYSKAPVKGYYNYNEYVEYRNKVDPERKNNDLLKGLVVNSTNGKFASDVDKWLNVKLDNLDATKEEDLKTIYYNKIAFDLNNMIGFSLMDEVKPLEDTLFLFIDFEYEKAKRDEFIINLYKTAQETGKNIIIYPLSLVNEESERDAFNWIKTFALSKPSQIMATKDDAIYDTFTNVKVKEEFARRFLDGVVSNNLIYTKKIGLYNPLALMKVKFNKEKLDKPYVISHDFLTQEQIKEFFAK